MKYIQYNCKLQVKSTFVSFWHFWLWSLTATLTPFGNCVHGGQILPTIAEVAAKFSPWLRPWVGMLARASMQGRNHGKNLGATSAMVGRICPPWLQ